MQDGAHDAAIQAREAVLLFAEGRAVAGLQDADRRPRRHHESHQQRKDDRRAGPDGDGPHVGSHQPAHEGHRKDGGHHREGGEDGGVAHFVDGFDGHVEGRPFAVGGHAPVTDDVLHHHDGVIHQDADGKDEGEQRDAVQGVAVEIENRQREGQGDGDGDEDDEGFAKPERDGDQEAHRDHRDQHVEEQLVGLFRGRFAVVSRDVHFDIRRNDGPLERLDSLQHIAGDDDGVGAFALGNGQSHGGKELPRPGVGRADVVGRFLAAVAHLRHVANVYRLVVGNSGHHAPYIFGSAQKLAGFEHVLAVAAGELAGGQTAVRHAERAGHLKRREVIRRQFGLVEHNTDGAALPSDQAHGGNVGHLLDGVIELGGDAAQLEIAIAWAGQGECQDGNVVDGARLHQGLGRARRNQVEVGLHFLVEADDALFFVLPHVEAHDGQGTARARGGVDVFHAGNLPQQLLHGLGDALLHLVGRSAGHLDHDVDHGHDDLRLLLARELPNREGPHQQRGGNQKRRQFG